VAERHAAEQARVHARGFSLVELLLVLLLVAVGSALVVPAIDRGIQKRVVREKAMELAAVARQLRARALREGEIRTLTVDAEEKSYRPGDEGKVFLPAAVDFSAVQGGEPLGGGARRFVFFPNGSILGGALTLRGSLSSYTVRLESLSGRVVVEQGG
jgi:general secretion pathway protein H